MAGISQTKTYGVSYVIHGDASKLTSALTGAKEQASLLSDALSGARANMQALFGHGSNLTESFEKLNKFYSEAIKAQKSGQSNALSTSAKLSEDLTKKTKALRKQLESNPIISEKGLIGANIVKSIQNQLNTHKFGITVSPILSANAQVTLQEQLSKLSLTVNVQSNFNKAKDTKKGANAVSPSQKKAYTSPTAKASANSLAQIRQELTQLQNYIKANPLTGNFRVNYGESRTQVQRIIGNLRQYAMTKPIRVPVEVVWGNAGGQLQNILSGLQSFANGHGIKTTAKVSGTATGGSTSTGSTLTDEQKRESAIRSAARSKWSSMLDKQLGNYYPGWKEEQMTKYDKWAAKFPGMAGAERLQNFSENYRQRQLRQTSLDKANKQAERIEKQHQANKQRVTDSVMRDIEKNNRAEIKERERLARESQKAQERIAREQAKAQERLIKEQERAAQRQAREQVKAQKIAQQRANAQRYVPGGSNGPIPPGGRGDMYTRMRKSWYPFTGNTSFGARTPMALDMAKGMGMMFAVSGVMQAVTSSFHQVAEYENMMKTVQAILKTNDGGANFNGRFKAMEEEVRRVGRETKFTAPEVAGAARFMAMAGLGIEDINAATNPIANLALVGDNDMSTTADKMTNIMTSFGLLKGLNAAQKKKNMVRASDILTNTFTKSNTDLMQLANAMEYAGTMSYMSGTDLADAAAMVGVMGNSGVQASMAGTSLRMIYRNIMKPTDKQQKEWDRLGVKRFDKNGNFRDIFDILTDLRAAITGSTDINAPLSKNARKRMALSTMDMFRATASSGTAAILMNLGEVINLAKSNREANGVAQTIADEKKNTISGLWAQVTSTFTDQSVNTVSKFTETIKDMLRNIRDWLATDEAAETLRNIYELAGSILDVFKWVMKVWKDIYSIAPGIIQSFIKYQFLLTQLGFLVTPIVQLVGSITTFKNALFGLSGAMTVASASATQAARANTIGGASAAALMATNGISSTRRLSQLSNIALLTEAVRRNKLSWGQYAIGAKTAFYNGVAAGTLNTGGIANGLRAGFAKAGLMLAKGVGMLVSPLGLATLALGGFVFALWRANKALEAAKARFDKIIKQGETTRQRAVDTYYNKGGISSSIIEDPTKYMNKVLVDKKIHFSAGRSGKDFIANPLLKNSKEWKAAFLEDNSFISGQPAYDKGTYEKIIRPFTQSWFGKDMSLQEFQRTEMQRSGMTFTQRYGSIHNAVSQLRDRAIITQVALSSKTFQNARNQAIKAWRDYANLDKSKQTTEAKEAVKNKVMNIAKGFQDKANYANIITGKKNNNIGNMRISDVANSREGLEVMAQNIMSLNNPNNSVTAIMQAGKIVRDNVRIYQKQLQQIAGAIPMQIRNIHGQLVNFKLPIGNNGVDWNALMTQFRILGVKFQNGIQGQMGMMLQMFNIVQDNAELAAKYAGMTAGQLANAISPINIGDTVNKNDWKPWVMLWAEKNQRLIKKMGFKDASDFFNENTKKTTQKWSKNAWYLQQIRANALNASTGNAKVTNKNAGNGNTKEINPPAGTDQSAYDSKYNNHQARPTQIIFDIDNLVKFDNTQVNSLDQKGIAESVGRQMAEGLHLMFAQAASEFGIVAEHNG